MKRILVTGASGFIGRHVLSRLSRAGFEIHGTCFTNEELANAHYGARWYKANLTRPGDIDNLLESIKPDYLLHLAWDIKGDYRSSPSNIDWLTSTLYLAHQFAKVGERAVFVGSCLEYDLSKPFSEEFKPNTLYGVCKHSLYDILKQSNLGNLSWAWARPFYIYGPWESPTRLIPSMINSALYYSPVLTLKNDGRQSVDYMYVEDVAEALITILLHSIEQDINITTGNSITVKDIAEKIENFVDAPTKQIVMGTGTAYPPVISGNAARLRSLGWQPRVNLERGLLRTIEWWRRTNSPTPDVPPVVELTKEPEIIKEEPHKRRVKKDG